MIFVLNIVGRRAKGPEKELIVLNYLENVVLPIRYFIKAIIRSLVLKMVKFNYSTKYYPCSEKLIDNNKLYVLYEQRRKI